MSKINVVFKLNSSKKEIKKMSCKSLCKALSTDKYTNKPAFEWIDENNTYVKPYFDIDIKRTEYEKEDSFNLLKQSYETFDDLVDNKEEFLTTTLDYISTVLNTDKNFSVSESEYLDKISFHVVKHDVQVFREDLILLKDQEAESYKRYGIDTAVYGKTQKFRCVGSSKEGLSSPLLIINNDNMSDHLITNISDELPIIQLKIDKQTVKKNKTKKIRDRVSELPIYNFDNEVSELVDMLKDSRADDYADWLNVGWCLRSISEDNFNIWDKFSKRSTKYDKQSCIKEWAKMKKGNYSINSLYFWVKQDTPSGYEKFINKSLFKQIEESLSATDADMSTVVYAMFRPDWVYTPSGWFHFNGVRWEEDIKGVRLYKDFKKVVRVYLHHRQYYTDKLLNCDDTESEYAEMIEKKQQKITLCISKLKCVKNIDNQIKLLKGHLIDDNFFNKIDKDPFLLGFEDGVFDLIKNEFRATLPEDYITKSTGHYFKDINSVSNSEIEEFNSAYNKIFTKEEEREFMTELFASCLNGISPQNFFILHGSGGNGKGQIKSFMCKALGEYSAQYNSALLTQKRSKVNSCTTELSKLRDVRYAICAEPETGSALNSGMIKELTGGDKISCRKLYSNDDSFIPQYTLFMETNNTPPFDVIDGGVTRRAGVHMFSSRFVKDDSMINEEKNIYGIDEKFTLSEVRDRYGQILLKILLDKHYTLVQENKHLKLKLPQFMVDETERYFNDTNVFLSWLDDELTYTGNVNDAISMAEIFGQWTASETYKNMAKMNRTNKKTCVETLLKSKYEIDYHYDGKTNGTKKHPKTKNKNTLSKYDWNCNIE